MPEQKWIDMSDADLPNLSIPLQHTESSNENETTIASVRKSWRILKITEEGTIVQTPSGKFRLRERTDGSLERLERIE